MLDILCLLQTLDKTEAAIKSGNFYEAQQLYKTVYYRYRARKQLDDSYRILKVLAGSRCRHAVCQSRAATAAQAALGSYSWPVPAGRHCAHGQLACMLLVHARSLAQAV